MTASAKAVAEQIQQNPDPKVEAYYESRKSYTALLRASHAELPKWRDPEAKQNRQPPGEKQPARTDDDEEYRSFGNAAEASKQYKEVEEALEKMRALNVAKEVKEKASEKK